MVRLHTMLTVLFFWVWFTAPVHAAETGRPEPAWWSRVQSLAEHQGYRLITPVELQSRINNKEDFLLLDVRPSYEYDQGHIPGAVNLEFHLGDRNRLSPEKQQAFERTCSLNKNRLLVIYCRSFR